MEKCLKTLTKQQKTTKTNNFKKQIKKITQNSTVITIIVDGKLYRILLYTLFFGF
jgi:ribosomal protein L25 (general stress protein Ctc)